MSLLRRGGPRFGACFALALFLASAAGFPAAADVACDLRGPAAVFPHIPVCVYSGAWQDSSLIEPTRCVGSFGAPLADSLQLRPRTLTLRFRRDRQVEMRPDFGGYRIYRVQNYTGPADTSRMVLIRRFSLQPGDERLWSFSIVDTITANGDTSLVFKCKGTVVHDSIVTFVEPDSSGNLVKVCRFRDPQSSIDGRCTSIGDSVLVFRAPPGPHDGMRTWYSITYEAQNTSIDGTYSDMFVPDLAHCATPGQPQLCPNLNNKLLNLVGPVEPTGGPTPNLERVIVVPNPFRAFALWDAPGQHELHFLNLPDEARIRIFTVAGDLVAELHHSDKVRDFERWNLKNQDGQDVSSGIYMYRVEASTFSFQDRFIVIR